MEEDHQAEFYQKRIQKVLLILRKLQLSDQVFLYPKELELMKWCKKSFHIEPCPSINGK